MRKIQNDESQDHSWIWVENPKKKLYFIWTNFVCGHLLQQKSNNYDSKIIN